ncbi:MAG: septum formation initiator family protein [Chloroflexota bacterium]|nr:septum formation initiator family protein [Chloroflexota bacterium]
MSVVLKLPTGKNRSLSTTAISVVLGLFALLFLVRFGQELLLEHDLNARSAAQRRANAALRDDNTRLRASLQYYQSTKYIEQRAREDLNLRRPDEEVLIPVGLDATIGGGLGGLAGQGAEENATTQEPSNWEKWFGLFAPAKSPDQFP